MPNLSKRFWRDQMGGTAIEYGLIIAIIGVGIVVSLESFTTAVTGLFGKVEDQIPG